MQELIFHHYWQSPVAEKVRVSLGFLGASWHSVEIPRIPPKPDLVLLTGGYRRTPVLQVGADIYCDSQCILTYLNRHNCDQQLYSQHREIQALGFANWANGDLFSQVVQVVLGHDIDSLPAEFLADRARLYFGADWTSESISAGVSTALSQCQVLLHHLQGCLIDGAAAESSVEEQTALDSQTAFIAGATPGLEDALCYYVVWFLRGRYAGGPELIDSFDRVLAWEQRVQSYGYGSYQDMSSSDAIAIARKCKPVPPGSSHRLANALGQRVTVEPDGDGGDPPVAGELVQLTHKEIVIARHEPQIETVHVHFPRSGYKINH